MRTFFVMIIVAFSLSGCAAAMGSSKNDKHQAEMALHKARTDVEDLRCDLNTTQSQLQILENKLSNHELTLQALKQETFNAQQTKLDELSEALTTLEQTLTVVVKQQGEALADLQGLSTQAGDTQSALSQYKEKISEVEHTLANQMKQIEDIAKLKQTVDELASATHPQGG